MDQHFIVIYHRGVNWNCEESLFKQAIRGHTEFLQSEYAAGRLLQAGLLHDGSQGLHIMQDESESVLERRLHNSPAVARELLQPEVRRWVPFDLDSGVEMMFGES